MSKSNKIAIIHDWFDKLGGSEKVVEQIIDLYPNSDIFSLVDFLPDEFRSILKNKRVNTSFIQTIPFAKKKFRNYLALMPLAIEQFDLSDYPLVISSSHAFAKGFISSPGQIHISYIHTPIRYAWDMQSDYLKYSKLEKGVKSFIVKGILHYIRNWDSHSTNSIDVIIANSRFTAQRIWKFYRRESQVVYPPVDLESFVYCEEKQDYFLTISRLVQYKQVELIIDAFKYLPNQQLIVIGDGPLFTKLNRIKTPNVKIIGWQDKERIIHYYQHAKALIFAAKEDFGIVPVESQACGTPVIAFKAGGVLETINGLDTDNPTGLFFDEQTSQSIVKAVQLFLEKQEIFSPKYCRKKAENFSKDLFRTNFSKIVSSLIEF